jgi:hypothetical protein
VAVVHELANVRPTVAHAPEPWLRHPSQRGVGFAEPRVDAAVSPNGTGKPQEVAHQRRLPELSS